MQQVCDSITTTSRQHTDGERTPVSLLGTVYSYVSIEHVHSHSERNN